MAAELYRFADFELDHRAYRLSRGGTAVHLQPIPFQLLCLLVERHGQLVTRGEILDLIWGKGVFIDSENSINTAVRKVRQALNDDTDEPSFVVTVPAKGYRFVATVSMPNGDGESSPFRLPQNANNEDQHWTAELSTDTDDASARIGGEMEPAGRRYRLNILLTVGLALLVAAVLLAPHLFLGQLFVSKSNPSEQSPSLPLPDKPSIAVLPFTNMSGDREQEYFSDGITDDLTTALSRLPDLFVIARTSAFTYKGKEVNVQDVSRELGVKYILEGSVEKAGGQVRITAQLVDATTGEDFWAEQYERPLRDIFVLQDEVVGKIVTTLKLQLTLEERGILVRKQADNLDAYEDFLRGQEHYWALTKQGNAQAREMFEKAIELDPKYADAYVALGFAHLLDYIFQWISDPHALDRAFQMAQKAVALDDSLPLAHALLGRLYVYRWRYDQAIAECERGVELGPNSANAYDMLAQTLARSGEPAESIAPAEKAMRLDPRNQDLYLAELGYAYTYMGRYDEAIPRFKKLGAHYNNLFVHFYLAVDYIELGLEQEARTEAPEILRINPQLTLQKLLDRGMPVAGRDRALGARYVADL